MVARIKTGSSIKGAIYYNELKLQKGQASLIWAHGFSKDIGELGRKEKWMRLEKLAALHESVKTNCLHVSLNFHPTENLELHQLQAIAQSYMNGIGFGHQPYLVYQHFDAGHSHLHIVSTNIQKDGKKISFHNLGRGLSERARRRIEMDFKLVQASEKRVEMSLPESQFKRWEYGKVETKKALSHIVTHVTEQYCFGSLAELNAALRLFGIAAYRGEEKSRMYEKKGLVYSFLNERGERIGVPIKASAIYSKPTLSQLEEKFGKGRVLKKQFQGSMVALVSRLFSAEIKSITYMQEFFKKEGVSVICRYNDKGFLYGVSYVDHKKKCVFKGSELGKPYSASGLRERFKNEGGGTHTKQENLPLYGSTNTQAIQKERTESPIQKEASILEVLLDSKGQMDYIPYQLQKKRKKKVQRKVKN